MSEVNAADMRIIGGLEDVIGTYGGAGKDMRAGIEVELAFFNPKDMTPMTIPQNLVLKNAALDKLPGNWVRNEPSAETIEVNSLAAPYSDMKAVLSDTNLKIKTVTEKARGLGLKRSWFQDLPEQTAAQLLGNIVDTPRYQAFFVPPRSDMMGFARYFTVCKSNQVSVSYSDPDHMLHNVRRLYALAPFLFMATDNGSGYREGAAFSGHAGMAYRYEGLREGRGHIPDYVFSAKTGDDYVAAHIKHVMSNPLYVYYDENGDIVRLRAGQWTSFNELKERGLNTAVNYNFAETVLWPDVKIAALRNDKEEVTGHRFEARMLGVGVHQHQSAFLIVAGLAFNEAYAHAVDLLLQAHGFDPKDPDALRVTLMSAYKQARNHDNRFFDIPYGNGSMADFAKEFADITEQAYMGAGFDEELLPLLTICRTGCPDAKVNRVLFDTLPKALEFQSSYSPALFASPNSCARILFENEIESARKTTTFTGKICPR